MSKIPVAKGGFRSWLSKNEDKPKKSVLYETKYQDHHDRIRNKENLREEGERKTPSTSFSMAHPEPSAEDFALYDEDRRFGDRARDVRVAQRFETIAERSSNSATPEKTSPGNDQYFTPSRGSLSGADSFCTPETSKKSKLRTPKRDVDKTPTTSKSSKQVSSHSESRKIANTVVRAHCLNYRLGQNFEEMQNKIFDGKPVHQARLESIISTLGATDRSPRSAERRESMLRKKTVLITRSSSQPPPIETLEKNPVSSENINARVPTPTYENNPTVETPIVHSSFVETLVTAHKAQRQYAETAELIEQQMSKVESIRNLAAYSRSVEVQKADLAPKKSKLVVGSSDSRNSRATSSGRKSKEDEMRTTKMLNMIEEIKNRIEKVNAVQKATHELFNPNPFVWSAEDQHIVREIDFWINLPFDVFNKETARQMEKLKNRIKTACKAYFHVKAIHDRTVNSSLISEKRAEQKVKRRLSSSAFRINQPLVEAVLPAGEPFQDHPLPKSPLMAPREASSPPLAPRHESFTADASTQMTARDVERKDEATQMTDRQNHKIEPLDLSSLEKHSPKQPKVEKSQQQPVPFAVADINEMLDGIQLLDTSLETIVPMSQPVDLSNTSIESLKKSSFHLKKDISFPSHPTTPDITPRSARTSLDSASARRLSAGVAHYLEQYKKEQEFGEKETEDTSSKEQEVVVEQKEEISEASSGTVPSWSLKSLGPDIIITSPTNTNPLTLTQSDFSSSGPTEPISQDEKLSRPSKLPTSSTVDDEFFSYPNTSVPVTTPSDTSGTSSSTPSTTDNSIQSLPLDSYNLAVKAETFWEDGEAFDPDATQFEHEREELAGNKTPTPPDSAKFSEGQLFPDEEQKALPRLEVDDEGDETKVFRHRDEDTLVEEEEEDRKMDSMVNDSADDSMFLLNDKPAPRLKSIFDNVPSTPTTSGTTEAAVVRCDTPRAQTPNIDLNQANITNEDVTYEEMDMDEYCRGEYLDEIAPIMIRKALEFQKELRGVDWVIAQSIWEPPSFKDLNMENFYDHFDYFDSFSTLLWGSVVELFNKNYSKFKKKLTVEQEKQFEKEALEMMKSQFGPSSRENEWCRQVKLPKKLEGVMPMELDYRYDVRRMLTETDKQTYQWQQLQMKVLENKFSWKELEDQLNAVFVRERENIGYIAMEEEAAAALLNATDENEVEKQESSDGVMTSPSIHSGPELGVSDV